MTESLPQEEEDTGESGLGGNEVERKVTFITSLFTQGATTSEGKCNRNMIQIGDAVFVTTRR